MPGAVKVPPVLVPPPAPFISGDLKASPISPAPPSMLVLPCTPSGPPTLSALGQRTLTLLRQIVDNALGPPLFFIPRLECPLWSHDGELLLYPARNQPKPLCEPAVTQPLNGSLLTDPDPPLVSPAPPDKLDGTLLTNQHRIGLLAHAALCSHKDGRCTIPHCVNLGRFRRHLQNCKIPQCRVPHFMVYHDLYPLLEKCTTLKKKLKYLLRFRVIYQSLTT